MASIYAESLRGIEDCHADRCTVALLDDLLAARARIAELERDRERDAKRLDWAFRHPESAPYFHEGKWRIPYLDNGAGGFGAGVGEMHDAEFRGVIDAAMNRQEDKP